MQQIVGVTLPFFALVLCGWLAARKGWLDDGAIPGLNGYVLFFALPCMLFRFGMNTPLLQLLNPVVLGVYVAAALGIVGLTVMLSRAPDLSMTDNAFGALVAAFPNSGFMGVPLLTALLGAPAAGPVICTLLADLFITSSLCIALAHAAEAGRNGHGGGPRAALAALRAALANPLPWAIALGALASVVSLRLPGPLDTLTRLLADSATPVALFTIGAVLCRAGRHSHSRTPVRRYLPVALVKLVLHPALVYALGRGAIAAGLPLSEFQLIALTLAAALPSASNVSLLAERHGADNGRIARIIMASTVLAFLSFTALAWVLAPH